MNERLYKFFAGLLLISSILIAQEILKITEDAPVFSEPNNNSQVIALAKKGEEAELLGEESSFYLYSHQLELSVGSGHHY